MTSFFGQRSRGGRGAAPDLSSRGLRGFRGLRANRGSLQGNRSIRGLRGAAIAQTAGQALGRSARLRELLGRRAAVRDIRVEATIRPAGRARAALLTSGIGLAAGAGLAYALNVRRRNRRRSDDLEQQAHLTVRHGAEQAQGFARDARSRVRGALSRVKTLAQRKGREISDAALEARVRAKLARYVATPLAIDVFANEGVVTLCGAVQPEEYRGLLTQLRMIPGVRDVESRLEVREAGHPAFEGRNGRSLRERLLQENWSPGVRGAIGLAGAALVGNAIRRRNLAGGILGALGAGLVLRAATNQPVARTAGLRARALDLHKTIHIEAPVEDVYRFWNSFENWPRFMTHLKDVRVEGERSHWVAAGPLGIPVSWDAIVTENRANEVISWRSLAGSALENAGLVRFVPSGRGTRVSLILHYNPPAGALGKSVASLFGADPERALDEDLARAKNLLERGFTAGAQRTMIDLDEGRASSQ